MVSSSTLELQNDNRGIVEELAEEVPNNTVIIYSFNELRERETSMRDVSDSLVSMNVYEQNEEIDWNNMSILLSKDSEFGLRLLLLNKKIAEDEVLASHLKDQQDLFYLGLQLDTEGNSFFVVSNSVDPEFRLVEENMTVAQHSFVAALMFSVLTSSYNDFDEDGEKVLRTKEKDTKKRYEREIGRGVKELLKESPVIKTNFDKKKVNSSDLSGYLIKESLAKLGFSREELDSLKAKICAYHNLNGEFGLFFVEKGSDENDIVGSQKMHCGITISPNGKFKFYISKGTKDSEQIILGKDADLKYFEFVNRLLFYIRCLNNGRYCQ